MPAVDRALGLRTAAGMESPLPPHIPNPTPPLEQLEGLIE
jgi:hypothetical protein